MVGVVCVVFTVVGVVSVLTVMGVVMLQGTKVIEPASVLNFPSDTLTVASYTPSGMKQKVFLEDRLSPFTWNWSTIAPESRDASFSKSQVGHEGGKSDLFL